MLTKSRPKAPANTGDQGIPEWSEQSSKLAFMEGKSAARDGTNCPYQLMTINYHMWLQGYQAEREWQDAD